ncbi:MULTISPECIES: FAD-binding oxidoreductase [unclassified Rhizobium]|uniref:NAD(P)/FAD-dependent oxidoreductase n=1 Tax=unclassified Rhizobium TaxID=2613769 RepID=UPI001C83CA03|nr:MULTISPECIES: FAD-binding oxidoreductase [unclassified Rhizobium]MBX5162806.1 FAD-binding oxidoreductase [Rhizobium sp. NZLR4b]MBX5168393.1 FAD-binding oxidoreductase [Rhizobium sp. NZLR1b]MBX5194039.1 FAD-binding oxidoreductase [Rhizobium sp. NZLR10]MBX5207225.1 FAD-binding oxidoreductase [Rhizobium sp. NZLR11]
MHTPLPELSPLPDAERRHVAVVGAGLVGLCSALWLQRMGHRVTIIDPAPPLGDASYRQACSYGNACTFAPHGVVPVATPGVIWRVPGMLLNPLGPLAIVWKYLPQLVPWLRAFLASSTKAEVERIAATLAVLLSHADAAWQPLVMQAGAERLKRHDGCLYLYKTEAQFRAANAENDLRERHGVAMDRLGQADIRSIEPNLAPLYHRGVLFRDAYVFSSPKQLAFALAQAFVDGGGDIVCGEVSAIEPHTDGIGLRIAGKGMLADHAVVAAGAHSRKLTASIGDRVLLDTERGYHVLFPQAGHLLSRPVCYPEHGFYMVPMADGLRAAGTVELGGLAAPLNPRRTAMIRAGVKKLLPAAGEGSDEWLGFRPSMPDSLPVIGNSRSLPRVTYAFGHGHLGLTLSALTGYLVSELVAGRTPAIDLAPLRPDRF